MKDATLGVDATCYLNLRLNERKDEPLKLAIGGVPLTLKSTIESDINAATAAGVTLLFVFNGLDFVNKAASDSSSFSSIKAHENGWKQYLEGDEEASARNFERASKWHNSRWKIDAHDYLEYPLETLYRYLRKVLRANGVEYIVAPYSALAEVSA